MTYCDAMIAYANHLDWISHGLLIFLGMWKMADWLGIAGGWIEKKIHNWMNGC